MSVSYTYWQEPDGRWSGYWNDYPEHVMHDDTIDGLKWILRDHRERVNRMVSEGKIPHKERHCKFGTMVMNSNEGRLSDIRGWWWPGVVSFLAISIIVYIQFDDYSAYTGWPFWWRVIMLSCVFGGMFLLTVYCDGSKKSEVSACEYLKNANTRIKFFWFVSLCWLVLFCMMPGKMVKECSGNNESVIPIERQQR